MALTNPLIPIPGIPGETDPTGKRLTKAGVAIENIEAAL
jgi:hypothetical protein